MASKSDGLRGLVHEDEVRALLSDLVAIPSVNPLHAEDVEPPFGEARVGEYVANYGRALGLIVEHQAVLPQRDNVLLTLEGADPGRRLLFECHMDTVPGWSGTPGPFEPRTIGGRLYGRGACDVKGTLVSMLLALRILVQRGLRPARTIVLAATVDEEHQARGVHRLSADGQIAEAAVIGEPTELSIAIAHKGCIRWRLTTHGRSAHSSKAELGINAIDEMVVVLVSLRRELEPVFASRVHPLVGRPSLSVCTIHGGVAVNVIPDRCTVEVDRRTVPGEKLESVEQELRDVVARIVRDQLNLDVELEPPFVSDPALGTPEDAPIVQQLRRSAEAILGRADVRGVAFGTDASKLSQVGIPSVVFGPGNIDLAHTRDESVDLTEVARAAEILAALALEEGIS
jgi:acetylornithine deacetylase/succinyl-diaminopimelate desuccinylase family protein